VTAARSQGAGLERFLEVRYEDLLADPAGELPGLYRWLGLDDRDEVVRPALLEAGVRFNTDPRRPDVAEGKWRTELSALDQRTFDRIAGDLLEASGYRRIAPPPLTRDVTGTARAAASAVAAAVRARPSRPAPEPPGTPPLDQPYESPGPPTSQMERVQELLDAVLTDFNDGDAASLIARLRPAAMVRIVDLDTGDTVDEGRDAAAHARFGEAVATSARGRGAQRRADTHPGEPLAVIVASYAAESGGRQEHTLVLGLAGDGLDRIVWYRPGSA
jgi:hypothetical protein